MRKTSRGKYVQVVYKHRKKKVSKWWHPIETKKDKIIPTKVERIYSPKLEEPFSRLLTRSIHHPLRTNWK